MARIAVINDYEEYAVMAASLLRNAGHEVLEVVVEKGPIDFEALIRFRPEAISVGLYRKQVAYDRPIHDPETDILGIEPIKQMESYPTINVVPILLEGHGLNERDIPTALNYDVFLVFPRDIKLYVPKLEELANTVKTRRKISKYVCPTCGSRLVFVVSDRDLFCPRDGTTVAIIDDENCIYRPNSRDVGSRSLPCTLTQITPPQRS